MSWLPLNLELLKNPYNWLIVGLMVAILGLALHLVFANSTTQTAADAA